MSNPRGTQKMRIKQIAMIVGLPYTVLRDAILTPHASGRSHSIARVHAIHLDPGRAQSASYAKFPVDGQHRINISRYTVARVRGQLSVTLRRFITAARQSRTLSRFVASKQ